MILYVQCACCYRPCFNFIFSILVLFFNIPMERKLEIHTTQRDQIKLSDQNALCFFKNCMNQSIKYLYNGPHTGDIHKGRSRFSLFFRYPLSLCTLFFTRTL